MLPNNHQDNSLFKKSVLKILVVFVLISGLFSLSLAPRQANAIIPTTVLEDVTTWRKRIWDTIKNLIAEHSALMWKQAQLYYGTRLAHDAAVFIGSGGSGQESFIWDPGELRKMKEEVVGEFLDNLSQDFFGQSACRPLDINMQVQIDLDARNLVNKAIGGVNTIIPNMCEEICKRTAPGGGEGELPRDSQGNLEVAANAHFGVIREVQDLTGSNSLMQFQQQLAEYSNRAKDLINATSQLEQETISQIGAYIYSKVKLVTDDANIETIEDFYNLIEENYGDRFASMLRRVLNRLRVNDIEDVRLIFYKDNFEQAVAILLSLGLEVSNNKSALGSAYLVEGKAYESEKPVSADKNSIKDLYDLFKTNNALIRSGALKTKPPQSPEVDNLVEKLFVPVDSKTASNQARIYQIYENYQNLELDSLLELEYATNDTNDTGAKEEFYNAVFGSLKEDLFQQAKVVYQLKKDLTKSYGQDRMAELVKQYENYNKCIQSCERGQMAKPRGVCTLDIINKKGILAGQHLTTGVGGNLETGPLGQLGFGSEWTSKDKEAGIQNEITIGAKDLKSLSDIGSPENYPLGQIQQVLLETQRKSEEAERQAEVEAQATGTKSKKSLISGEVVLPGSQVEKRLDNALASLREQNNQYTGSILADMWGVFFNTLIEEFINNLYDKGLEPKMYGGAFNPAIRRTYGTGVAAMEKAWSKFREPSITAAGEMNTKILTRLVNCSGEYNKRAFDECVISESFRQAIEKELTLQQAVDQELISKEAIFGYSSADGQEPSINQGIPYASMVVLRKYRIIPSSWEAAAVWIKNFALKAKADQPTPDPITLEQVMAGYKDPTSPYYGLVNPDWILKLPLFKCDRQLVGEHILSENASLSTEEYTGDFDVQLTRDTYCADAVSCLKEDADGINCDGAWGYCTRERDYWRFPTPACEDARYKTCQAFENNKTGAVESYLEQTISSNLCPLGSSGCQNYLRDYNYLKFTDQLSSRVDSLSDNAFTYAPLSQDNIVLNATGLIDQPSELYKCLSGGESCYFEKIPGREDGCLLSSGLKCIPGVGQAVEEIVSEINNRYWCGLPGGAGCFVSNQVVPELTGLMPFLKSNTRSTEPPNHTTSGIGECIVGYWAYNQADKIYQFNAVEDPANANQPLKCRLYTKIQTGSNILDSKSAYLTENAKTCNKDQVGCQAYWTVEFPSDVYQTTDGNTGFLSLDQKKQFVINLQREAENQIINTGNQEEFNYQAIELSSIIPEDLQSVEFKKSPEIVPLYLNNQRIYCTERDVNCRRYFSYPAKDYSVAGILDPQQDLCPKECVGYSRYREMPTILEQKLNTDISFQNRFLIPQEELYCPAESAGCERFIEQVRDEAKVNKIPQELYLTDIRFCVKPGFNQNVATYTIIESSAEGSTSPRNTRFLKSNFTGSLYYTYKNDQVSVYNNRDQVVIPGHGSVNPLILYEHYNGPCVLAVPDSGGDPEKLVCQDTFSDVKSALEQCLIIKEINNKNKPVANLSKPECREYIYFPENAGAERYPIPYDLPIRESQNCKTYHIGSVNGALYNIDLNRVSQFGCLPEELSCKEYQGRGWQISGSLDLDFEIPYKWGEQLESGYGEEKPEPDLAVNINAEEDQALKLSKNKLYQYNILPMPQVNPEQQAQIMGKTFKLSFWLAGKQGEKLEISFLDAQGEKIENQDQNQEYEYEILKSNWYYTTLPQFILEKPPAYIAFKSVEEPILLDNINLATSASIYLISNKLDFKEEQGNFSISSLVPESCKKDYSNQNETITIDPLAQLNCQAYYTDLDNIVSWKSIALCREEVAGCRAMINTFNTTDPRSSADTDPITPRGEKNSNPNFSETYDQYFVPKDSLEYIVYNSNYKCSKDAVGCTLFGQKIKDTRGVTIGFEQKYLIDDLDNYQDQGNSIACLAKEVNCQTFKRAGEDKIVRFQSNPEMSCQWVKPSGKSEPNWYKKDSAGTWEKCRVYNELLDPAIDLKVSRPMGYCVQAGTGRPILDARDSADIKTGWCDSRLIGLDDLEDATDDQQQAIEDNCLNYLRDGTDSSNDPAGINTGILKTEARCVSTLAQCPEDQSGCTWFKDPLESGLDKHYFNIDPVNATKGKGCGSIVSNDKGCRLFYDTEKSTEEPDTSVIYNSEQSLAEGGLNTECNPLICYEDSSNCFNSDGQLKDPRSDACPAECLYSAEQKCNANRLIKVERDRTCGEWLQCVSSMITSDGETVCLERKPCNSWAAGGGCANFSTNANQEFTNKEIYREQELFSRLGRLSGFSNVGYRWGQCGYSDFIKESMQGQVCVNSKDCLKLENIYIDENETLIESAEDGFACVSNTCGIETSYSGDYCESNLDCYSDEDLYYKTTGVFVQGLSGCNLNNQLKKQGFKSLDHIAQVGQYAQVVNGDFEEVAFELSDVESKSQGAFVNNQSKKPTVLAWELGPGCGAGNACQLTARYDLKDIKAGTAIRESDVFRGKYSFKIDAKAKIYQIIDNIVPNASYVISAWIKSGAGEEYNGIEIVELQANNTALFSPNAIADPGLRTKGTEGWEYFSKFFTVDQEARKIKLILRNDSGNSVLFDNIQIRAHLEAKDGEYIAPTCRLYPEEDALNCDARDKQGNLIRGWRGYCIEPDPRWDSKEASSTNQCVQWWPIDIVQGETNVLGKIDTESFLDAPSPLYYCLESKDKDPELPMPRLVCLAKNSPGANAQKYESCTHIALVSDPKPKFYSADKDSWIFGVTATDIGYTDDGNTQKHYGVKFVIYDSNQDKKTMRVTIDDAKVALGNYIEGLKSEKKSFMTTADWITLRFSGLTGLIGKEIWEHMWGGERDYVVPGLCVVDQDGNRVVKGGEGCVANCFEVEGLQSWNKNGNGGLAVFKKNGGKESTQLNYGGCGVDNWQDCADILENYYYKVVYFKFTDIDGGTFTGDNDGQKYCKNGDGGIYRLLAPCKPENNYDLENGSCDASLMWRQGTCADPFCFEDDIENMQGNNKEQYLRLDNFAAVTYGQLVTDFYKGDDDIVVKKSHDNKDRIFTNFLPDKISRESRPQQCSVLAQTIDFYGQNKAWFSKVQAGKEMLKPLGFSKTNPLCVPFGAAPYIKTPDDIMIKPIDKKTREEKNPVTVPLELYHPENLENNKMSKVCQESYRGEGFYACGGVCNVCVGGDEQGKICISDKDCQSGVCGFGWDNQENLGVCSNNELSAAEYGRYCQFDKDCKNLKVSPGNPLTICVGGDQDGSECENLSSVTDSYSRCRNAGGECIAFNSCRKQDNLKEKFDPFKISQQGFVSWEKGQSEVINSGLRRLQQIFAKIYKIWQWKPAKDQEAGKLKETTGVETGKYQEVEGDSSWDITNLPETCYQFFSDLIDLKPGGVLASDYRDFPGCIRVDRNGSSCVPPYYGQSEASDDQLEASTTIAVANLYRDYDYCRQQTNQTDCQRNGYCEWINETANNPRTFVPYQNPYPNVYDIKVNSIADKDVVLRGDKRQVNLTFKIKANQNQLPITTIIIDWDDGSQTALSGIAWQGGDTESDVKTFTHSYTYYPEGTSDRPLACENTVCEFRPRIKVIDNWGWCNGTKISNIGSYRLVDYNFQAEEDGIAEQGEGLSWGYYGADCFKTDIDFNSQSWDYFLHSIKLEKPSLTTTSAKLPTAQLVFKNKNGEIVDNVELFNWGDYFAYLTCQANNGSLTKCKIVESPDNEQGLNFYNLDNFNGLARQQCNGTSCQVSKVAYFYTSGSSDNYTKDNPCIWEYSIEVADELRSNTLTGGKINILRTSK